MKKQITFPAVWLAEARAAYDRYVVEWRIEEEERVLEGGGVPEAPQHWDDFLIEYHYAELENSVLVEVGNRHMDTLDR